MAACERGRLGGVPQEALRMFADDGVQDRVLGGVSLIRAMGMPHALRWRARAAYPPAGGLRAPGLGDAAASPFRLLRNHAGHGSGTGLLSCLSVGPVGGRAPFPG